MYSILLVVQKPTVDSVKNEKLWKECIDNLSNLATKNRDIELLGENVLLIPLQNSLTAVSKVVPQLLGLGYKYIIFPEELKWYEVLREDQTI